MKRQEKVALLQRLLEGNISKEELDRQMNPDPSSITAVLVTPNAEKPHPNDLVTANLSFEGNKQGKLKCMPYCELERLMQRVGGTVFALPDNNRDRV